MLITLQVHNNADYTYRYNGHPKEAVQAVRDIQWRATYEMYADVIMVRTNCGSMANPNPNLNPNLKLDPDWCVCR
jgi:hypothetical protein